MIRAIVFVTLSCAVVSFAPPRASAQSPNPASIAPGSSGAGLAPATPAAPSPQPRAQSPIRHPEAILYKRRRA
jgi:hypothetical protein